MPTIKKFDVLTEEKVMRSYRVRASCEAEARAKFIAGEYDRETPGEAIDCEVVEVVEVQPESR